MLAPTATLTHPAFRTLVHEYGGCDRYFSEMISAEAFQSGTPFEYAYRDPRPDSARLVYQLVGRSEKPIVEAARRLAAEPVTGIDLNMGCAALQIAKRGAGIARLDDVHAAAGLMIGRAAAQVQQIESYEAIKHRVAGYFAEHPEYRLIRLSHGMERSHA
ncbi:MAG: tRNA-dihydrouridine synthase [Spirochaetaceae bacterium]